MVSIFFLHIFHLSQPELTDTRLQVLVGLLVPWAIRYSDHIIDHLSDL